MDPAIGYFVAQLVCSFHSFVCSLTILVNAAGGFLRPTTASASPRPGLSYQQVTVLDREPQAPIRAEPQQGSLY